MDRRVRRRDGEVMSSATHERIAVCIQETGDAIAQLSRCLLQNSPDAAMVGGAAMLLETASSRLQQEDMSDRVPRAMLIATNHKLRGEVEAQAAALAAKDELTTAQTAEITRLQESVRSLSQTARTML